MTLPTDISTEGWRIDRLLQHTSLMVGALAAAFVIWLVIALWRGTRSEAATESRRQQLLPLAVAGLVFVVIDGFLFVTSTRDLHSTFLDSAGALSKPGAVRVEISGHQWAWAIRYAGPDGRFATRDDPVTTSELVVPVSSPIVVQLASLDVVHSLHLPAVRIKRDAIPGDIQTLWFEATAIGSYDMACAQFCGTGHYKMTGTLRVVPRVEYDAWIASASADSVRIADEDERSLEEDPAHAPLRGSWPRFRPSPLGRDWGWPWAGAPR